MCIRDSTVTSVVQLLFYPVESCSHCTLHWKIQLRLGGNRGCLGSVWIIWAGSAVRSLWADQSDHLQTQVCLHACLHVDPLWRQNQMGDSHCETASVAGTLWTGWFISTMTLVHSVI